MFSLELTTLGIPARSMHHLAKDADPRPVWIIPATLSAFGNSQSAVPIISFTPEASPRQDIFVKSRSLSRAHS